MNEFTCFDWHNRISEYLDSALSPASKRQADLHLDHCQSCLNRLKHHQEILKTLSHAPRERVPASLRQNPLAHLPGTIEKITPLPTGFDRLHWSKRLLFLNKTYQWQNKWYLQAGIEGFGIMLVLLAVVSIFPKVRSIYEKNIERRLEAFNLPESDISSVKSIPLVRGKDTTAPQSEDDFSSEGEHEENSEAEETDSVGSPPKGATGRSSRSSRLGKAEIWRFNLRADNAKEIRPKIIQILTDHGVDSTTKGIGGREAPGGIQFDLLVPSSKIDKINEALQKLASLTPAPKTRIHGGGSGNSESGNSPKNFTWFKNRSKAALPNGFNRIVIWVSQL